MGDAMFAKFNDMFDIDGLKKDLENVATNTGDFVDVPKGDYEVKVVKLELGETGERSKTPGMPMVKVWFEVLAGEYAKQKIFMNQMLTSAFGIHKMNEFLTSLETGLNIGFEDFEQYDTLLKEVFDAVDGKAEYQLSYGENNKGYSTYEIVQKF